MTPEEHDAQRTADLVAAGAPHGLSAEEVERAQAIGQPLHRVAAIKNTPQALGGGRSVTDLIHALDRAEREAA